MVITELKHVEPVVTHKLILNFQRNVKILSFSNLFLTTPLQNTSLHERAKQAWQRAYSWLPDCDRLQHEYSIPSQGAICAAGVINSW